LLKLIRLPFGVAFQFSGDPANKAALILSSLQGALQMARALGTEQFHAVVYQHKQDLAAFK
jgi:hypothetical protein